MRYFFDVHNGNELTRDEVGMELEGINQARDEAAEALAEMASGASRDPNPRDFAIEVRDELGQPILKAEISFAVQTVAGVAAGYCESLLERSVGPRWVTNERTSGLGRSIKQPERRCIASSRHHCVRYLLA